MLLGPGNVCQVVSCLIRDEGDCPLAQVLTQSRQSFTCIRQILGREEYRSGAVIKEKLSSPSSFSCLPTLNLNLCSRSRNECASVAQCLNALRPDLRYYL